MKLPRLKRSDRAQAVVALGGGHGLHASLSALRLLVDDLTVDELTAIVTVECVGSGTRYVFTGLHRNEADLATNMESGFHKGTEMAIDQLVEHVMAMR